MKISSPLQYSECSNGALTVEYRFKDSYPSHLSPYLSLFLFDFNVLIQSMLYDKEWGSEGYNGKNFFYFVLLLADKISNSINVMP